MMQRTILLPLLGVVFWCTTIQAQEVLTKEEAVAQTLENNFGIKIANNNLKIADNNKITPPNLLGIDLKIA